MRRLVLFLAVLTALHSVGPAADYSHWQPLYPNATPGLFGSFQAGIWTGAVTWTGADYLLWAKEEQAVAFTVAVRAPAKATVSQAVLQITSPSGKAVESATKGPSIQTVHNFIARETGVYLIHVGPNEHPVLVNSSAAPLCLLAQEGGFHFSGSPGDLFFQVPAGVAKLSIKVGAGSGKLKSSLFDAKGNLKWTSSGDIEGEAGAEITRDDTKRSEVWRIRLDAPAGDPHAEYDLALEGVPPVLAASPEGLLGAASGDAPPIHAPRILLIGDSLMSTVLKPPAERPTLTGWGQVLPEFFNPGIVIDNRARSGRSARSFMEEGLWIDALKQPWDYVVIAFGGNDEKWGDRYGDPATSFRDYLRAYAYMARARGIRPIFASNTARRTFGPDGKITTTQRPYVKALQAVADELHIPFVNLLDPSIELCERVGEKECEKFSPGDNDRGHFSREMALIVARFFVDGLKAKAPELRGMMREP